MKYIDRVEPHEGLLSCTWTYVEFDFNKGLLVAINLNLDNWPHIQEVEFNQIPFKCKFSMSMAIFPKAWQKDKSKKPRKQKQESNGNKLNKEKD